MLGRLWNALLKAAPLRLWAMILAGPPLTVSATALVAIIWQGGWPEALRAKQLDFIGWALIGNIALLAIIIVTLAAVRVRGTGPGGTSIEIDADDDDKVTITKEPTA